MHRSRDAFSVNNNGLFIAPARPQPAKIVKMYRNYGVLHTESLAAPACVRSFVIAGRGLAYSGPQR